MAAFSVNLTIKCSSANFFSVNYSCKTFEDDVQCSKEMKEVATDKSHCGYLNPKTRRSSPFNICLAYKPTLAKQMFESCIYDVCSYFDDVKKRTEAACRAAEGLETICEASGFDIQWRSSAFCRKISVWSKFISDKSKNKALSDNTIGSKNNHYICLVWIDHSSHLQKVTSIDDLRCFTF